MTKRSTVKDMMNVAEKRLGATTGKSTGRQPAPKGKVRVKPSKNKIRLTYTKSF